MHQVRLSSWQCLEPLLPPSVLKKLVACHLFVSEEEQHTASPDDDVGIVM